MSSAWVTLAAGPMRSDVSGRTPYRRQSARSGAGPPPPPQPPLRDREPLPAVGPSPRSPQPASYFPAVRGASGAREPWVREAPAEVPADISEQTARSRRHQPQGSGSAPQHFIAITLLDGTGPGGDPFFFFPHLKHLMLKHCAQNRRAPRSANDTAARVATCVRGSIMHGRIYSACLINNVLFVKPPLRALMANINQR